jgi:hypothetical protein
MDSDGAEPRENRAVRRMENKGKLSEQGRSRGECVMVHKMKKCESCKRFEVQWELKDKLGTDKPYKVCTNCLGNLASRDLQPKEFKNLLKSKHSKKEFLLHEDFYDEKGNALQPRC